MARYTGPRTKISRRFGVALFGSSKALERRNFPPGQHGVRAGRKKKSEYSVALGEKQKLRFQYGVLEKQFRGYYEEAARRRGVTGVISSCLKPVWTMFATVPVSATRARLPAKSSTTATSS